MPLKTLLISLTMTLFATLTQAQSPLTTLYPSLKEGDYNPSAGLEKITATLLAINSADDERNPPELGVLDREIKRVKGGRVLLIPGSEDTAGHGTTGQAKYWKVELAELLKTAPALK